VLIVRRAKLYYAVSGIITPIGGHPVHRLREKRNFLIILQNTVRAFDVIIIAAGSQ
jgi:hypothetical protein